MAEKSSSRVLQQKRNDLMQKVIRLLYRDVHGMKLSQEYRQEFKQTDSETLTYGEIVPESFMQILSLCDAFARSSSCPKTFVDLGCGTGKAVFVASLGSSVFERAVGIDIIPGLVEAAQDVKTRLEMVLSSTIQPQTQPRSEQVGALDTSAAKCVNEDSQDLLRHALHILSSSEEKEMRVDKLATLICTNIGSKKYKLLLRPYRTFQRFLFQNMDYFTIRPSDVINIDIISSKGLLLSSPSEADENDEFAQSVSTRPATADISLTKLLDEQKLKLFSPRADIEFINGDIFEEPWWEYADIAYAASLLFSDEMIYSLSVLAAKMKTGSHIISLKPLYLSSSTVDGDKSENRLALISESFFKMSWQMAKVYVYRVR